MTKKQLLVFFIYYKKFIKIFLKIVSACINFSSTNEHFLHGI